MWCPGRGNSSGWLFVAIREFAGRDVNLRVRRASIHTLIGPKGGGKTTCFNLLTKLQGDISAMAPAHGARLGLVGSNRYFRISQRSRMRGSRCGADARGENG